MGDKNTLSQFLQSYCIYLQMGCLVVVVVRYYIQKDNASNTHHQKKGLYVVSALLIAPPTLKLQPMPVLRFEGKACRRSELCWKKACVHSLIFRGSLSESCKQPESTGIGTQGTQSHRETHTHTHTDTHRHAHKNLLFDIMQSLAPYPNLTLLQLTL